MEQMKVWLWYVYPCKGLEQHTREETEKSFAWLVIGLCATTLICLSDDQGPFSFALRVAKSILLDLGSQIT